MTRNEFLASLAAGALGQAPEVVVERASAGKPHKGKVLAAIQPHADDIPIFAGGTVLKLIEEGYTGYLIRTTNDDHTGPGTVGEGTLANERDNFAVAKAMGLKKVYDLYYRNHMLDAVSPLELRLRLIFLFRLLRVDTVVSFDPWGHYEENPDHYVTASAVEAACWMSGMRKDYPEHFDAGLEPHPVREKYYYARGPQLVNRVVDISGVMERKIAVNALNVAQGPAGRTGAELKARLAARGLRLPVLGEDEETANREYIRRFVLEQDAEIGARHGVKYAEAFHYIGPEPSKLDQYIQKNAVPLRQG